MRAQLDDLALDELVVGATTRPAKVTAGRSSPLGWFAGARPEVLDRCPSERGFYHALGLAVLLTAAMSGVTLTIIVGYVLHVPASHLWPLGLLWSVVICNIDRLLQMMTSSKDQFLSILPRLLISCVIGVLIAEPLTLRIFEPEINQQLQRNMQQAVESSTTSIAGYYGPQIAADQRKIASLQAQEHALEDQVVQDQFLAACEAGETACSTTHELGCGPYCQHYQELAVSAQNRLKAETPQDNAAISELSSQIQNLTAKEGAQTSRATSSIAAGSGLIAREDALLQIMRVHPGVLYEVWFIRITLVLLDILPLLMKYLYVALGDAAYERINAASRRREASSAHAIDVETRVEISRVNEQGFADEEVNRVMIQADRDRRISDIETGWQQESCQPNRAPEGNDRIPAIGLGPFVGRMYGHESMAVAIPRGLRAAGWAGSGLVAGLAVALGAFTYFTHRMVVGEWLVFLMLLVSVSLMAFTKGFREAPPWGIRATFGTLIVGLALPVLILVFNL